MHLRRHKTLEAAATLPGRPLTLGPGWIAAAVLAGMTCLVFWPAFVYAPIMLREDLATLFQPYYTFAAQEVAAGRFPQWNPYLCMGVPFHASLQPSLLYPLRWPMFFMDFITGCTVTMMLHYFLTALASYHLLRGVLKVGPPSATLGAMIIAFGGFTLGHLTHPPYFMAYPWFLLAVLFIWRGCTERRWTDAVLAGLCLGLMGLIGAVHLLLVAGVLLGTFVIYQVVAETIAALRSPARRWRQVARAPLLVAAAGVLGVMVAAAQLLPAWAETRRSVRMDVGGTNPEFSWRYINAACAHPGRNALQMVVPFFHGNYRLGYWGEMNYHESAHYVGIAGLMLAAAGLAALGRRAGLGFWLLLALMGFVLGAGWYLPAYRVLYEHVPLFNRLRNPTRIFWCTDLALACLATVGAEGILAGRPADDRRRRLAMVLALVAGAAILATTAWALLRLDHYARHGDQLVEWMRDKPNLALHGHGEAALSMPGRVMRQHDPVTWMTVATSLVSVGLVAVLAVRRRPAGRRAVAVLGGLLMLDLFLLSLGMTMYDTRMKVALENSPRAQWLQDRLGIQRFAVVTDQREPGSDDQVEGCLAMLYGIRNAEGDVGGNVEYPSRVVFREMVRRFPHMSRVAGVKYLLVDGELDHPQLREAWRDYRYVVYENLRALPMAFFVSQVTEMATIEKAFEQLARPELDVGATALVDRAPPPSTAQSAAQDARVLGIQTLPGRWRIETQTDQPAQLVVLEGYAPGWRCQVDGAPTEIYRTNVEVMSVPISAGRHSVQLWYDPREFKVGLAATAAGLAVAIIVLILKHARRAAT